MRIVTSNLVKSGHPHSMVHTAYFVEAEGKGLSGRKFITEERPQLPLLTDVGIVHHAVRHSHLVTYRSQLPFS